MVIATIKTTAATVSLVDDKIILFKVHDHTDFGLPEMLEVRQANIQLAEGNDYCVVMEMGQMATYSKEAKEASVSEEHNRNRIALAIVQTNLAMKLIAQLYIKFNKPITPTKIVKNTAEAIKWLQQKRDEHYGV